MVSWLPAKLKFGSQFWLGGRFCQPITGWASQLNIQLHKEKQTDNRELNANYELSIPSFDTFSSLKGNELLKVEPNHN